MSEDIILKTDGLPNEDRFRIILRNHEDRIKKLEKTIEFLKGQISYVRYNARNRTG